jgi:hypothetical protein
MYAPLSTHVRASDVTNQNHLMFGSGLDIPFTSDSSTAGGEPKRNENDENVVSEWRINVSNGTVTALVSPGFESKHFRSIDHDGGAIHPALPVETYRELLVKMEEICAKNRCRFFVMYLALVYVVFMTVFPGLLITMMVLLGDANDDHEVGHNKHTGWDFIVHWAGKYCCLALSFVAISCTHHWTINWMLYNSIDGPLTCLVEELRKEYEVSYGVLIGYRSYKSSYPSLWPSIMHKDGAPCVWLKGLHNVAEDEEDIIQDSNKLIPTYPSMFFQRNEPADVWVGEKEYHPSTGYDEKTWTLITETHNKLICFPCPAKIVFILLMLGPAAFGAYFEDISQSLGYLVSVILFSVVVHIPSFCIYLSDRFWLVPSYRKVAEKVTKALQADTSTSNTMKGFVLIFEESPILGRASKPTRRYELVRVHPPSDDRDDKSDAPTATIEDEEFIPVSIV